METITNAALYLTKYPSDLAKILPQAKSDGGLLRKATRVDFVIGNQQVRFNIMPKADMEPHLAAFAGYMKRLKDQGVNSESEIRKATALLPGVACVLGGVFSEPFPFGSQQTEMLFAVAHRYQGYVFMLDTLFSADMKTICGPIVIEQA